ncbi:exopolysaccharide biosynthesis polyprenyl glycosylphosphotransferase [Lutibacter sp. A80]|uniref:exopolysaccharide biosynthesis polyprenyl glycosylphosphotransferase n=1 Tax=Lutibacter sp. A80 TaxID=2918453 RepID=UPI001F070FDF|nr:exopolysaccharide biosynthesis polyprenyl glycosylphosphotransferase [Lutibacter sp. A80]UMB61053.1 exopolysaccharide biosynthesis polyprenyl glycosylphosphotransferase [Lutibacter sp. A80]
MLRKNINFSISERKLLLKFFDILFVFAGLIVMFYFFDFHYFKPEEANFYGYLFVLICYVLLFGQLFEMYNLQVANDKYQIFKNTLLTGFFTSLFYVFTPIITPVLPVNRLQILYLFLAITVSIYCWRFIYTQFVFSPLFFNKILIISSDKNFVADLIKTIKLKAPYNYIVGYSCPTALIGCTEKYLNNRDLDLKQLVEKNQINEIVVDGFQKNDLTNKFTQELIFLFKQGVTISNSENFMESIYKRIPESQLNENFYNHLNFNKNHQNKIYLTFHRLFDVVLSIIGICFLLISIPFIYVGNVFFNKGSLFYLQERVGKGGFLFKIIKFRTMVPGAEKNGAEWAQKNDARITKFGKFLRNTRLDEVPQFINILKGEMSVIGPRPERPEFVEALSKEHPFYTIRNVIKPGLTGWAQVEYPYASSKEEQYMKLRYDLYYMKERNLLLDFKIIIKTISTILFYRGN